MVHLEKKYRFAVIATDVVIFTVRDGKVQILLIKMKKQPYAGGWALPGGLVRPMESVDAAALRHLALKTGVKRAYLEQLYTFGKVDRDPFGRVVSVAYMALIPSENLKLHTTKEYADVLWLPLTKLPRLAYDHSKIIAYAVRRLQAKLGYSNIAQSLLPEKFTLSELQHIYEVILHRKLDKRNFRKKILSLRLIRKIGEKKVGGPHRPAEWCSFTKKEITLANVL